MSKDHGPAPGDDDHTGHDHRREFKHRERDRHAGHDHAGHSHSAHAHAPKDFGFAFAAGTALNLGFVVIEAAYGFLANSMALLADAGHNLSDVFGLLMAWGAATLAKRAPTPKYTYGFRPSSILAALANAILLLVAVGAIAWEAVQRLWHPEATSGLTVMAVAAIGIVVNGMTAWLFMSGQKDDLNIRGAYLHMAADAAVSLGVVIAGAMILSTGWLRLDPIVSLIVAGIIVWGTWSLLKESVDLALHAVPAGIEPDEVRAALVSLEGVKTAHDLHIWPMSTTETALTCHLVMPAGHPGDAFIVHAVAMLKTRFNIHHATLQIERGDAGPCAFEPDHVV